MRWTLAGVEAVLLGDAPALAGFDRYVTAVDELGVGLGSFVYVDMARALRLTDGSVPIELDQAERVLEAFIIDLVTDGGITRVAGLLTIEAED